MHFGKTVFAQLMDFVPAHEFRRCVHRYQGDYKVSNFSCYLMDRAYLDFQRLYLLQQALAFFIIRSRKDFRFHRVGSHPVVKSTGRRCDQTIRL